MEESQFSKKHISVGISVSLSKAQSCVAEASNDLFNVSFL